MKKLIAVFVTLLIAVIGTLAYGNTSSCPPGSDGSTNVTSINQLNSSQSQYMQGQGYATAEGGSANAEGGNATSSSGSISNISTNSVSNYETRTSPVAMFPPYLPTWSHGGWGTVKAYFQNGPNGDDKVYERAFNPGNPAEMRELRGVIESLPYDGPINFLGGIFNGFVAALGGPDNFHHGRGFEISSSVIRARRPRGKPLLVFIDSNINRDFLRKSGIAYVGKISLEGTVDRNWDHVYEAAIAEALPWNVDIILISGGMKGVTIGSNFTFPAAGGAYSQTNYSLSLLGGHSKGITEGKGEAIVSAECYRYDPKAIHRRTIPQTFYDKIHSNITLSKNVENTNTTAKTTTAAKTAPAPVQTAPVQINQQKQFGVEISQELYEMAGFSPQQQVDYITIR
ncbi:MAG: hypothetical protein JW715_16510 [Sedimentisphaerales bacterium]|nr:hypothetical protein [Sedimentisphaerales bacterium]